MSLASRLVRYAPSIRRAHEQYATGPATRAAMTALRAGPPTYEPPSRLGWRVDVVAGVSSGRLAGVRGGPTGGRSTGHLVFLHGGAYFRELRSWHWWFVERLVRETGLTVLVPVYPLAPIGTADIVVPAWSTWCATCCATRDVRCSSRATRPAPGWRWPSPRSCAGPATASRPAWSSSRRGSTSPATTPAWPRGPTSTPGCRRPVSGRPASHTGARSTPTIRGSARSTGTSPVCRRCWCVSGTHDILNADAHRLVDEVSDGRRGGRAGGGAGAPPRLSVAPDAGGPARPSGGSRRGAVCGWPVPDGGGLRGRAVSTAVTGAVTRGDLVRDRIGAPAR